MVIGNGCRTCQLDVFKELHNAMCRERQNIDTMLQRKPQGCIIPHKRASSHASPWERVPLF